MKKILSLVLVILMLSTTAISVSAIDFWGDDDVPYVTDSPIYVIDPFAPGHGHGNGIVNSPIVPGQVYTSWYDKCNECGVGIAFYKIENRQIIWRCLNLACAKNGVINIPQTGTGIVPPARVCDHCEKADHLVDEGTFIRENKLYRAYFCTDCEKFTVVLIRNFASSTPEYDVDGSLVTPIVCDHDDCFKVATYLSYEQINGKLYYSYICGDGHVSTRDVSYIIPQYPTKYSVNVICSTGGGYTMTGGVYGTYGEQKKITFTAHTGYEISNVVIDGVSYGAIPDVTLTVRKDTLILAYFSPVYTNRYHVIQSSVIGNGSITTTKNGNPVSGEIVAVTYGDTITYKFTPASSNYYIKSVKIDGVNLGRIKSYTFKNTTENHKIEVTFAWEAPYIDMVDKYLPAVEYVTEAGIMFSEPETRYNFYGYNKVTVEEVVAALAEMADTKDLLDKKVERLAWALEKGLITAKTDLEEICDVQTMCELVKTYLGILEDLNKISFDKVSDKDSAKETALKIELVSENGYAKNRELHRFDLASVCLLISELEY